LNEEAVSEAERIDCKGVPDGAFCAEHIVAIAAHVGRAKDTVCIEQLPRQADFDKAHLEDMLQPPKRKPEMRQNLAREPFAEEMCQGVQLILQANPFPRRSSKASAQMTHFLAWPRAINSPLPNRGRR
jgi:hypothetical protein